MIPFILGGLNAKKKRKEKKTTRKEGGARANSRGALALCVDFYRKGANMMKIWTLS